MCFFNSEQILYRICWLGSNCAFLCCVSWYDKELIQKKISSRFKFFFKGYTKVWQGLYPSIGWREAWYKLKFEVMHIPWCFCICFIEFLLCVFLLQLNTNSFPSHALIKSKCNSSLESQQHCLTTVPLCISFTVAHLHGLHLPAELLISEIIFLRASSAHLYTHVLLHLHSVFSMTDYAALCYECSEYESYIAS